MKYSLIIPVYNRPDEVDELLASLETQTLRDFEVVIVEDGSQVPCEDVVRRHAGRLSVKYYRKENGGPGPARNYGADRSGGEYLIVLDSDCVLPPGYLQAVDDELTTEPCEAFGGPDRAHESFTPVQKAISYGMTSFLTTGGIRGGRRKLDRFYPRSFNMGLRSDLWQRLGGFSPMRFGEDIDLSLRIYESGARCRLFPGAWVWHKRRTDLRKFFRQVFNSGMARINLWKRHPGSLRPVHLLPALFTLGLGLLSLVFLTGLVLTVLGLWVGLCSQTGCNMGLVVAYGGGALMALALAPLLLYGLIILIDSSLRNRSLRVGLLSIPASLVQLTGYGMGFMRAWWQRFVMGRDEDVQAFRRTFYK
ncbi:MAG: glycosyltransferase [Bacteroidaceae bacterium]|nr:glycosyltransferase [Bacteroidaceae bacterium]